MSHVARERLARQIAEEPSRINVMPEITIDVNVSLTEPQRMPAPLEYGTTKRGVADRACGSWRTHYSRPILYLVCRRVMLDSYGVCRM